MTVEIKHALAIEPNDGRSFKVSCTACDFLEIVEYGSEIALMNGKDMVAALKEKHTAHQTRN